MKLKDFIESLQKIQEYEGDDVDILMADMNPVVEPIFHDGSVYITDEEVK